MTQEAWRSSSQAVRHAKGEHAVHEHQRAQDQASLDAIARHLRAAQRRAAQRRFRRSSSRTLNPGSSAVRATRTATACGSPRPSSPRCTLTFPTEQLYVHLVRVLVYLIRTKNLGITYSAHAPHAYKLRARADSNWSEIRSTTGFVIFLAGATINNGSRRQHCISMSSCEAELIALAETAIEL
eukprot:3205419-Prymnesium_polylepis.1